MQFMVLGYDGKDSAALDRRLKVRDEHLTLADKLKVDGNLLYAAALLENGLMTGSMMIVDFPSQAELDEWLKIEPYVVGDVWEKIEVTSCQIGPSFVSGNK